MKTFGDCKVGDEIYILLGLPIEIEAITKINDGYKYRWICTEHHSFFCPKNEEQDGFVFCTCDLAIKELEKQLFRLQNKINTIQQSINDLKEI